MAYPLLRCASTPVPTLFRKVILENRHTLWLSLLTLALSIGWFLLDGHINVNLSDEGFLWYGTHAMRHGQVPMRDFQAYDPGRYLWTVAWSYLLGDGLAAMRLACVFFQCLGVLAGLLAVRRLSRNGLFLAAVALLLCAWMHPRYKVFEQSIALMSVYAGVLLLERPTLRRLFAVGIFGGLMAFMGRNHGAYHVVAFGLLIGFAAWGNWWRAWCRRGAAWCGGLFVGYLPQWLMFLFVPGYWRQFVADLGSIFTKGTNLTANVPWPWIIPNGFPLWWQSLIVVEGCFYIALPVFLAAAAIRIFQLGRHGLATHPVFLAAACVSLPYTHYVFSRPDTEHLTHGAPAMVLGVVALGFTLAGRWPRLGTACATLLLGASLLANVSHFGIFFAHSSPAQTIRWVSVNGERMLMMNYHAHVLASAQRLAEDFAEPDEPILFLPNLPGLYPFTGRRSPTRQIYFIFPASPEEDRALLAEIDAANVQWVMLHDYALDGRDDLRFRNTNPIVFAWLRENFDPVPIPTLPRDMSVLRRARRP